MLVVGIDIRGADDAPGVDHEPSRHWQGPTVLAIADREVIAKAEIDPFEVVGQLEPQTELRGACAPHTSATWLRMASISRFVKDAVEQHERLLMGIDDAIKVGLYLAGDTYSLADVAVILYILRLELLRLSPIGKMVGLTVIASSESEQLTLRVRQAAFRSDTAKPVRQVPVMLAGMQ